jgi:AcrR family transcriptional regulator
MLDLSDKERAIIAAAQRIFALHGYSQARVEDIAQAAGVGKGTVYEYFSSKQAVFEQAVEAGMSQYMDGLEHEIQRDSSPIEKLRRIAVLHMKFVTEHRNTANIIIADPAIMSPHRERLREICQRAQDMVAGVIKQGIEAGLLKSVDALLATQTFLGVLSTVGVWYLVQQRPWDPERTAALVTDLIVYGLASPEG